MYSPTYTDILVYGFVSVLNMETGIFVGLLFNIK